MKIRHRKRGIYATLKKNIEALKYFAEESKWLNTSPVGRELGSKDYERFEFIDNLSYLAMSASDLDSMKAHFSNVADKSVADIDHFLTDPITAYQVAVKCLIIFQQPFFTAIDREKNSDAPNAAVVEENKKCLDSLFDLRHNLRLKDADLIAQIIDPNSAFRKNLAAGIISYEPI